jgi:hypothetical protein
MKSLYKLDLEPNEIYNVSLNIKQGNKTVDNLRFFQTKAPKLFNLKPSNFTTTSQIVTEPDAVIRTQTSSGVTGGAPVTRDVTSISWTEQKTGDFYEGELTSEPTQVTYTFTINLDGAPKMMGYQLTGFSGPLAFLNYRNDFRPSGNSIKVALTLSQIDPIAQRKVSNSQTVTTGTLDELLKAKGTRIKLKDATKGLVPGNTMIKVGGGPGVGSAFPVPTFVSGYTPGSKFVTLSNPANKDAKSGTSVTFTSNAKVNGFDGTKYSSGSNDTIYDYLSQNDKSKTTSSGWVSGAQFKYETFPTYGTPTYRYTFSQSSYIRSSVINPNVLESLVWEDTVRDFIFFVITDNAVESKKYFFGTYGQLTTLAAVDKALVGNSLFNRNTPPAAPGSVTTESVKSFTTQTPKIKFFEDSDSNTTGTAPPLSRAIKVQFCIARYTKRGSSWNGVWLGAKNGAPVEADILSSPEALQ